MDKTVLYSTRAIPDCTNYAVGIFQDGELHVTPLRGIIQMRPQFNYLDKGDKRAKDDAKTMGEGIDLTKHNLVDHNHSIRLFASFSHRY